MISVTHELKILDSIEELAYCTECLKDSASEELTQRGESWHYVCPHCQRFGGERANEPVY
jgi:hypothetical protein